MNTPINPDSDPRSKQITVLLDDTHSAQLEQALRATGWSVAEVVHRGIEVVWSEVCERRRPAFERMEEVGFVGCGEGPEELSQTYKAQLWSDRDDKSGSE